MLASVITSFFVENIFPWINILLRCCQQTIRKIVLFKVLEHTKVDVLLNLETSPFLDRITPLLFKDSRRAH